MSQLLAGHRVLTCCIIIAPQVTKDVNKKKPTDMGSTASASDCNLEGAVDQFMKDVGIHIPDDEVPPPPSSSWCSEERCPSNTSEEFTSQWMALSRVFRNCAQPFNVSVYLKGDNARDSWASIQYSVADKFKPVLSRENRRMGFVAKHKLGHDRILRSSQRSKHRMWLVCCAYHRILEGYGYHVGVVRPCYAVRVRSSQPNTLAF